VLLCTLSHFDLEGAAADLGSADFRLEGECPIGVPVFRRLGTEIALREMALGPLKPKVC
jgi:hypothetical protein